MRYLLLAVLGVLSLGCQGSSFEIGNRSTEQLASTPTDQLAWAFGSNRKAWGDQPKLRAELERRNAFTPEQWDRIDRKKIVIGDPVDVVYAAWGSPSRIRNWTTEYSGSQEFEYYHVDRSNFVYIRDGRVAAVDN